MNAVWFEIWWLQLSKRTASITWWRQVREKLWDCYKIQKLFYSLHANSTYIWKICLSIGLCFVYLPLCFRSGISKNRNLKAYAFNTASTHRIGEASHSLWVKVEVIRLSQTTRRMTFRSSFQTPISHFQNNNNYVLFYGLPSSLLFVRIVYLTINSCSKLCYVSTITIKKILLSVDSQTGVNVYWMLNDTRRS